jgi:hypothetical protein
MSIISKVVGKTKGAWKLRNGIGLRTFDAGPSSNAW